MSHLTKIIVTSITCGLISSILAGISGAIVFLIFLKHIGIFSNGTDYSLPEKIISLICLLIIAFTFFICPFFAYHIRQSIFAFTDNFSLQIALFAIVACSQLIFLGSAYCGTLFFVSYGDKIARQKHEKKFAPFYDLAKQLDDADVKVSVKKAKILSDDGKIINAEITLQINNVPFIIPYYEFSIFNVEENKSFFMPFYKLSNDKLPNPYIKASNQNGKWIFFDTTTNTVISDNSDEITVRIEFFRKTATQSQLPRTITPRLGIWKRDDNVYIWDHVFFIKPIPIEFE